MRLNLRCAKIKYQYKIDFAHVYEWVKIVNKLHFVCMHMVSRLRRVATQANQEEDRSNTDTQHVTFHVHLGCVDGYVPVYHRVVYKTRKNVCA